MSTVVIVLLVAAVVWLVTRDARAEWVAAEEARWDAWVEAALIEGNAHSEPADDVIFQQLCFERWEADL